MNDNLPHFDLNFTYHNDVYLPSTSNCWYPPCGHPPNGVQDSEVSHPPREGSAKAPNRLAAQRTDLT